MNQLFLLKLTLDLIKENSTTSLKTAQTVLENMIKEETPVDTSNLREIIEDTDLSPEAIKARKELLS